MRFEIYGDEGGGYRWRLVADNGETVADSAESYDSPSNARRAVDTVQSGVASASVEDQTS